MIQTDQPVLASNDRKHVLVKVHYCGVNPVDAKYCIGDKLPKWLTGIGRWGMENRGVGFDFSGVVVDIPQQDSSIPYAKGDAVFGVMPPTLGSFRDYVLAPMDQLYCKPKGIELREAAVLPLSGLTGLQALRYDYRQVAGNIILIIGASGGVGHFVTQIAKIMGLKIVAVCSRKNHQFALRNGADFAVDYRQGIAKMSDQLSDILFKIEGNNAKFNMVFDCVSSIEEKDKEYDYVGWISESDFLDKDGVHVTIGGSSMDWVRAGLKRSIGLNLFGKNNELFWVRFPNCSPFLKELSENFIDNDLNFQLKPRIAAELPFSEKGVRDAFQYMHQRRTVGKVVLKVD